MVYFRLHARSYLQKRSAVKQRSHSVGSRCITRMVHRATAFFLGESMAKSPAFQFYVRDWICSRKVACMTGDQVKAYLYLLCEAWLQEPRATLPNDDRELAEMARVDSELWEQMKESILRCFKVGACKEHFGRLYSERQLEVSRKYDANQRLGNKNANKTRTKREVNAKKRISSSSSSSSSAKEKKEKESAAKAAQPSTNQFSDQIEMIIAYLNESTGMSYRHDTKSTQMVIAEHLKKGTLIEDFKIVIDSKVKEWSCDDAMSGYLRPITLFGDKFEGYLQVARREEATHRAEIDEARRKQLEEDEHRAFMMNRNKEILENC